MKLWIGSLAIAASLTMASLSAGQDFPTFQGNNGRTGKNATPAVSNPGQGFITWFRPNATDAVAGSIVRNNTAVAPNVTFSGGWTGSPGGATGIGIASFSYDQAPFGDLASDEATGGYAVYGGATPYDGRFPAYYYTNTVASTSATDPTLGATQSFTWTMDPTQAPLNEPAGNAKNYALYVWLPIGSTGNFPTQQFPQRFNVYRIAYGPGGGKTFIDVVDTYASGPGWVRLGNGGSPTNLQFAYDGTTPITITLLNTVPRNAVTGNLSDNAGTTLVYADAAMAIPQVGEMQATPTVAQLLSATTHTVAAVNEKSVGEQNGNPITVSQGVVTSYDYATGARRWTFRPAEQAFTFTMDDLSAGVTASAGFAQQTIGVGTAVGRGTTYYRALIAAGGTEGMVYDTGLPGNTSLLEDGQYQVQIYIAPSVATETHGNGVKVFVRENGVDLPFYIDEDQGPGWYTIGTRRFSHTQTTPLRVEITNDTNLPGDVGKYAYADSVRFIGAFDTEVNSTPTNARVNIRQPGGAVVQQDVVIVACEDGHIYCLDAQGNGDGTTHVIWAYPSLPDTTNASWVDPNITAGIDGAVGSSGPATIAQMPVGFGRTSPIVQNIGGNDYIFIASRNGRVYCIDATGRGDYDFTAGKSGTTTRIWSYPSDYPSSRRAGSLGTFTNASIAYAAVGGTPRLYVPTETGHLYALDPVGNVATRTTTVLWDFPGRTTNIQPITTTPTIDFGRVYFGTAEDATGSGRFYSLDAAAGNTAQQYIPVNSGSFVGGPATATAAEIGAGGIDTIFIANSNRTVYAFDAANLGNVIWQTDELNTTVTGALAFTPMNVYDRTSTLQVLPTVVVPGANGYVSALFARGGAGIDATNIFNTKLAWQYSAADLIVASMAVGGPAGFPGFMYTGDLSGNLYAWSNTPTLAGEGEPPGDEVIPPNDPRGAIFRDAKIKVVDKPTYDLLREDPTTVNYTTLSGLAQNPPFAFEWGETAYFVVYDFPYAEDVNGNASVTPSLVNFQISTDGATTRQFAVVARQITGAPANKDGYAILAFAIQGSGPNSLPPGRGRVSYTVSPGRSAANVNSAQVAQDPNQAADFHVNNPIGVKITPTGINDDIGVTTNRFDAGAAANGSPDIPGTPGNNESLLTSTFGMVGHNATGTTSILVYDRSLMTLLRGPDRGLDQVRVARPELEWLGGSAAVVKPIPTGVFGTLFEDVPDERPNISIDYPNVKAEQIRVTKDPNGNTENPGFSGVFLKPPLTPGGQPIDDSNKDTRVLQPTIFEFDVDVPRFQPANNSTIWTTSNGTTTSGYSGRVNIFVDSNLDGALDTIGGRSEAYRGLWLNGSVAIDEGLEVRTPNVDLGSLPSGAGYAPGAPGTGANTIFTPWGGPNEYTNMFKSFVVENPGNVNLLNLRVAKATYDGTTRLSWGVFSSSVDDFGWLDAGVGLWSDIDATFARTPQVILQKARVGDRGNSVLSTNPIIRVNPNLDVNTTSRFLPAPFSDDPRVAVTLPPGFPVGTYSQVMRVIEDTRTADQSLDLSAPIPGKPSVALESYSDPTFTLTFKARETRLTNSSTLLTVPMIDDPAVLGTATADFMHQNLQPTAARAVGGHVVVAWTSSRPSDSATQPISASKNDLFRIYLAGLNGNNGTPDGRSDPTNAMADLTGFLGAGGKWFQLSPSTTTGYPAPGYLYPTATGETVVGGTEKYGAPSLPNKGFVNPFVPGLAAGDPVAFSNLDMAFIGEAQKQTASGRTNESRLFMTRLTVDNAGVPTLDATPTPMPYDPMTQKGKPSVLKLDVNRSLVFYSALGAGNSNIFWTVFDYSQRGNATTNGFTTPATLDFGDGFESIGSPSISGRQYVGGAPIAGPVLDLSFTGKLRGRSNTEVFLGRISAPNGVPQALVGFPEVTNEVLTPDRETGSFRAKGVEWDTTKPIQLFIQNGTAPPTTIDASSPADPLRIDRETGLVVFNTSLGGKAYIDPRMGTVRLTSGLPLTTSKLLLTYTPKFKRTSVSTAAGSVGVSMFVDNRFDGVRPPNATKYWAEPNGNGIVAGDHPQTNRMFLTYNRAAAGAGQSARPLMQTMRLGIQLPFKIYTDQGGNLSSGGTPTIQFIGAQPSGFFQVDPVKGRVYFSPQDEDRQFTIRIISVDSSTGAPIAVTPDTVAQVSWITESSEAPVPIEQAVNESTMFAFPDPFDSAAFPRPNLVWMFWTSTRGGAPDLYFQTVAPRFAPQPGGN